MTPLKILPKRNIGLLWAVQLVTSTGDAVYQIALMWLVLDLTGSTLVTGLVALSAYLPAMLFGLWAGVLADRYQRLFLMVFSNFSQALTVISLPVLLRLDYNQALVIGLLAFIRSSFSTLFPPAFNAYVPLLVPRQFLLRVNSLLATSAQLAYLIGPASAAVLLSVVRLEFLFTLVSLSFLAAIGFLRLISKPDTPPSIPRRQAALRELLEGLKYVFRHETLGLIVTLTIINNLFIMGPAIVGMPILVKTALGGTASHYAAIEACYAVGMLFSSLVIYRTGERLKKGTLLMAGMIIDGSTFSLLYFLDSIPVVMGMIVIHALGIPMITIARTALIQRTVPNQLQGRVFSMIHLAVVGLTGISSALVGLVTTLIPIKTVFLIIGSGAALCGLYGLSFRKIRNMD